MAIEIVRFETASGDDRWATLHTTSDTMFAPIFFEELIAELFGAFHYQNRFADLCETAQMRLSAELQIFLDELCPADRGGTRQLPAPWILYLLDGDSSDEEHQATYDGDNLLEDLQSSNRHTHAANFVLSQFSQWRRAR
jgi:hypothetical protein